jgi:ornithine cyclodeaminase/alanine dehydrogenase-like protein (mu-crystallin family)
MASGGVAAKHLARPDAEELAIVGAGFQASCGQEASEGRLRSAPAVQMSAE